MKWLAVTLGVALVLLQYRLWFSGDGVADLWRIRAAVSRQQSANEQLGERNRQLAAEVRDLKQGDAALEERARTDLGMIGRNETFFQVTSSSGAVPAAAPPAAGPDAGAAAPVAPAAAPGPATHTAAR